MFTVAKYRLRWSLSCLIAFSAMSAMLVAVTVQTDNFIRRSLVKSALGPKNVYFVGFDEKGTVSWLSCYSPPDIGDSVFSNLILSASTIDISNGCFGPEGLRRIEKFNKIKLLDLSYSNCNDQTIMTIPRLLPIEVLKINGTAVTDDSIPAILSLTNLKGVDIRETNITPQGLEMIEDKCISVIHSFTNKN